MNIRTLADVNIEALKQMARQRAEFELEEILEATVLPLKSCEGQSKRPVLHRLISRWLPQKKIETGYIQDARGI